MLQPYIVKTVKRIPQTFSKYFHQYFKFKTYKTWDGGSYESRICFRKTANVENIVSLDRLQFRRKLFKISKGRAKCGKTSYESFQLNISYLREKDNFQEDNLKLMSMNLNSFR